MENGNRAEEEQDEFWENLRPLRPEPYWRVSFGVIPQEARDMAEQMLQDGVKPFKKPYKIIVNE